MRRRVLRRALGVLALTAALMLAAPAGALAAGPRADREGGGWSLTWQRLADLWDGLREAAGGLVPTWEAAKQPNPKPAPTPSPAPPKTRGNNGYNGGNGDDGGGIGPDG